MVGHKLCPTRVKVPKNAGNSLCIPPGTVQLVSLRQRSHLGVAAIVADVAGMAVKAPVSLVCGMFRKGGVAKGNLRTTSCANKFWQGREQT